MKNTKYELTKETKDHFGTTLYRIKALKDFGNVVKGELGGFIEKEANLDVYGDAWVSGDARVYGDARVSGDAWVSGDARVYGDARVSGKLKLEAGLFFGVKWSSDTEIKQIEIGDGNFLVYKGGAKFGTDEEVKDEEGEVIELNGKKYRLIQE